MSQSNLAFERLHERLAKAAVSIATAPLREALGEAKIELQKGIRAGFNSSVDVSTGVPWAPRKRNYAHPPLMKTGAMMQAAIGSGAGSASRVDDREVSVGVYKAVIKYASYHQDGTFKRPMPARPFVGASEETLAVIGERIAEEGLTMFV